MILERHRKENYAEGDGRGKGDGKIGAPRKPERKSHRQRGEREVEKRGERGLIYQRSRIKVGRSDEHALKKTGRRLKGDMRGKGGGVKGKDELLKKREPALPAQDGKSKQRGGGGDDDCP